MVRRIYQGLPRLRTMFSLGCIVLFCTFYWDWIFLHRLYNPRKSLTIHRHRVNNSTVWSWKCVVAEDLKRICQRVMSDPRTSMSLATCASTCSPGMYIWPVPTGSLNIKNTTASFHPHLIEIKFTPVKNTEVSRLLKKMTKLYQDRISNLSQKSHTKTTVTKLLVTLDINKLSSDYRYKVNIDEGYRLIVNEKNSQVNAIVKANTFLGAHHGLETLTQLIWWDDRQKILKVLNSVIITDNPHFTYRGLLLDTARNFIPIPSIYRTIDAMSMSKMNVFHWHLTDSMSFPYNFDKYAGFKQFGPYSSRKIYSASHIKNVVEYAEVRGVSVLIEVSAPGHTGQGWEWGEKEGMGNISLCINSQPFSEFCAEPPCGQLNPANDNASLILVQLLKEFSEITKFKDLLHIGGDDVDFRCWESFGEVIDTEEYLKKGVTGVWNSLYKKILDNLTTNKLLPPNLLMWSNDLLEDSIFWKHLKHPPPIIISQGSSTSGEIEKLIAKKYRIIVSSRDMWHLSDPQTMLPVYLYRPWIELTPAERKQVLGGEACAWTGYLDHRTVESRLWPITAVVAERLWSDPAQGVAPLDRLALFRERMIDLGVSCSPVFPKWCLQNPFECL